MELSIAAMKVLLSAHAGDLSSAAVEGWLTEAPPYQAPTSLPDSSRLVSSGTLESVVGLREALTDRLTAGDRSLANHELSGEADRACHKWKMIACRIFHS